jgi:uncharacterized protein YneF (UPF0154 family)
MFRILFLIIAVIILYKLIFGFIIPVYRASRDIRRQFRKMNEQMAEDMNRFGQNANANEPQKQEQAPPRKDYIDFEEVK